MNNRIQTYFKPHSATFRFLSFFSILFIFSVFYLFYLDSSKAQDSLIQSSVEKPQKRSYDLSKSFAKLINKAQERGAIPVIVGFHFDLEPEGYLTNTKRENQRASIKQSQDLLIQKLTRSRSIKAVQFQTIPYLALAADVETLELLRGLPEITFIGEDDVQFTALAESTVRINAPQAWSAGYSGQGQVIAILDTGVDKTHPFLTGKIVSEACFSANVPRPMVSSVCPNGEPRSTVVNSGLNCTFNNEECGHGTHVAGIAAGRSLVGNRQGVAKDANIVAIQVFSRYDNPKDCPKSPAPCIGTHPTDYTLALEHVVNLKQGGMNIASANLSIGGGNYSSFCDSDFPFLRDAINHLRTLSVATVAASGNDGFTSAISRPACISSAISVGSTNDGSNNGTDGTTVDVVSTFMNGGASNSADFLSLLAPGKWIDSSILNGGYANFEGTSMAAPHVAGAWAVLKQSVPNASVSHVLNALKTTGQPINDSRNNIVKPRINLEAALQALGGVEVTSEVKISASDGTGEARFGDSVAVSGDTIVVGNPNTAGPLGNNLPGAAYIYIRNSDGTWSQQAKLSANDTAAANLFGTSVAISGNTVIIGTFADSAYVFVRNGTTWTQQQKLTASDGIADDHFGYRVAISGDTSIVGSYGDDTGTITDHGSAYIFVRNGTTWTQQQKLTAGDGAANDFFGISVAISGDTAIVGSYLDDIGTNTNQGSAYVFVRNGTTWTQQQKITANDGTTGNAFGLSAAIEGDTAIIGKTTGIPLMSTIVGAAYIFVRNGTTWTQQQKLLGTDGITNTAFGESVAINNNRIIVGAHREVVGAALKGAAYIFVRNGTIWIQEQKLIASDGLGDDQFGSGVAIVGNTSIVGAYRDDNPAFNQGSAYIFTNTSNVRNVPFDFDRDGRSDISVFRPSNGQWWYLRSSDSGNYAAQFGNSSDKIVPGDFTGDGKTDIAFFRPSTGEWFILRSEDGSYYSFPFGTSGDIPAAGDFDGDGKADQAVFRPTDTNWYIRRSSDSGFTIQQFGANGDVPVVADYDGDLKADIAIWRASAGQWWISRSTAGVIAFTFGNSADKPVQGDYTGDGKTDVAVWRASTGEWFILRSENASYYSVPFGTNGDIPAPGDFDGDGKFDASVFRPADSNWYIQRSTAGTLIRNFGIAGDKPVPGAFVP